MCVCVCLCVCVCVCVCVYACVCLCVCACTHVNTQVYSALMKVALVEGEPHPPPGTPLFPTTPTPTSTFTPTASAFVMEEEVAGGGEVEDVVDGVGGLVTEVWKEALGEGGCRESERERERKRE